MKCSPVLFLVLALMLAPSSVGQEVQKNVRGRCPPHTADEMGPFVVSWGMDPVEREKIMSRVRSFFWEHLQNHAPGQVQITFGNLEGDPTEHTLLIRSDKKGNTAVFDHISLAQGALLAPGEKPKHKKFVQKLCIFERLDKDSQKLIPDDEKRSPESFELRLQDCKGMPGLIL